MTPPLANPSSSGISDNLSQGHCWTPTNTTPGGCPGYNSGYNSASGYVSGDGGSRSGTGSPGSSHSHSFPGYGSCLVHRSNRGALTCGVVECAGHKRRGRNAMPLSLIAAGKSAVSASSLNNAAATTSSTPSPRQPFIPASPMTPPLTNISGSEISGDNLSQGHGWTPNNTTPGGRSGCNSGYNSASGYISGGGGSRSGTGSPGSSHSHSFPGYGSGLVHRSNRGAIARGIAEPAAHKRRGSNAMRMTDEDSYGSDGESKIGRLNISTDAEIRRQRIESEQRRRDDLREGFACLKNVLPVSNQEGSKMPLLDRVTCHIRYLEAMQQQMQAKLTVSDMEVNRLRQINEALMLKAAKRRSSQSPL
ncbi:helix loop helix DNA-binding domain protein, partial [Rhizoctonia solani AG-3 Rhs1AP]